MRVRIASGSEKRLCIHIHGPLAIKETNKQTTRQVLNTKAVKDYLSLSAIG